MNTIDIIRVNGNIDYYNDELVEGARVELFNGTHGTIKRIEIDHEWDGDECIAFARIELRTEAGNWITLIA